jgi:hypothetical protein
VWPFALLHLLNLSSFVYFCSSDPEIVDVSQLGNATTAVDKNITSFLGCRLHLVNNVLFPVVCILQIVAHLGTYWSVRFKVSPPTPRRLVISTAFEECCFSSVQAQGGGGTSFQTYLAVVERERCPGNKFLISDSDQVATTMRKVRDIADATIVRVFPHPSPSRADILLFSAGSSGREETEEKLAGALMGRTDFACLARRLAEPRPCNKEPLSISC